MVMQELLYLYRRRCFGRESFVYYTNEGEIRVRAEEFVAHIQQAACYFQKILYKGQRAALIGENSYAYLVEMFALFCSGNIAVPLNPAFSAEQLYPFLKKAQTDVLICADAYQQDFAELHRKIPLLSMESIYQEIQKEVSSKKKMDWENGRKVESSEVILMLLSSGTSGVSKLVPITHENLSAFPESAAVKPMGMQEKTILFLPFYHIGGTIPLLEEMMLGNCIYLSSAKHMARDICLYPADKWVLVPAMMKRILKQAEKSSAYQQAVKVVSKVLCLGAAMDEQLIDAMLAQGITPKTYYGMTETTGTVSCGDAYRRGACGQAAPFNEIKIENGEILIRGRNVMTGYVGDAEETKKIFRDGWLHTGDLGEMDADGYLYVKGRSKNIILLSNGENICPEELEALLYGCQEIEECMVFGEEDCLKARVYGSCMTKEREKKVEGFVRNLNHTLPPSHRIKKILFSKEALEKNSMGKLLRRQQKLY